MDAVEVSLLETLRATLRTDLETTLVELRLEKAQLERALVRSSRDRFVGVEVVP